MAEQEETIWVKTPSHLVNAPIYLLCVLLCWLIIPAIYGLYRFALLRAHQWELTSQRLICTTGLFSRHTEKLELYRVRDISVEQPFPQRFFQIGNIVLDTSDHSNPLVQMQGMAEPRALSDQIRHYVEATRVAKGVKVVDHSYATPGPATGQGKTRVD